MTEHVLSTEATRLLVALHHFRAESRAKAVTHRRLADHMRVDVRQVIDAARELLAAGHLVLATCRKPPGVWLGTLAEALAYREQLTRRVKRTAGRICALDIAINRHRGQLTLGLGAR